MLAQSTPASEGGDHDNYQIRTDFFDPTIRLHTVNSGHSYVHEDEGKMFFTCHLDGLVKVTHSDNVKPFILKNIHQGDPQSHIIVDYHYLWAVIRNCIPSSQDCLG